jgi:Fe-S oxidoreductase
MKLGAGLIEKAYAALREGLPGLGFSSWCCAKPTLAVGAGAQKTRRAAQLRDYFRENGVQTVYTLCPNCQHTLAREFGARARSAWPLLADCAESRPLAADAFDGAAYGLHDPCASREDADSQAAARRILAARGVPCAEFARHGAQARCCGRRDMLFLTRPAAAKKMLDARLDEAGSASILTYCESCVEAFRGAGRESFHLLEILFNRKAPRAFVNRVVNARPEAPRA